MIHTNTTIEFIEEGEILAVEAMENYTRIHFLNQPCLASNHSFGKILNALPKDLFCQCHRSYSFNLGYLLRYHKSGEIELSGGLKFPVSRRRKEEVWRQISRYCNSKDKNNTH